MANKANGDDFKVYIGSVGSGTLLAHVTSVGLSSSRDIVDVTDKDSNQKRELLGGGGKLTKTLSVQGFYSDSASRTTLETNHDAGTKDDYYLVYPLMDSGNSTAKTKAFEAVISQLEAGGEVAGEMTFSATFEASGAVTTVAES
jgi:predicted secreted protein